MIIYSCGVSYSGIFTQHWIWHFIQGSHLNDWLLLLLLLLLSVFELFDLQIWFRKCCFCIILLINNTSLLLIYFIIWDMTCFSISSQGLLNLELTTSTLSWHLLWLNMLFGFYPFPQSCINYRFLCMWKILKV